MANSNPKTNPATDGAASIDGGDPELELQFLSDLELNRKIRTMEEANRKLKVSYLGEMQKHLGVQIQRNEAFEKYRAAVAERDLLILQEQQLEATIKILNDRKASNDSKDDDGNPPAGNPDPK